MEILRERLNLSSAKFLASRDKYVRGANVIALSRRRLREQKL